MMIKGHGAGFADATALFKTSSQCRRERWEEYAWQTAEGGVI